MYAIIETGGKQFKVAEGDVIRVEKLPVADGEVVAFDKVLVLGGEGETAVGAPYLDGAKVSATVLGQGKEKKVVIYKYKSKKDFHNKKGHRQPFTSVKIDSITR